eukprot:TRINITY_DN2695_c0_g1_i3.p1 TRINITY_DN2695_c0_g1~~TRINITY_DN2695_c0_g1_i3.p1  ORF type:complete len:208 (+),score=26.93 TRINITY_DN2695_c0_g1_i3:81-704(+)
MGASSPLFSLILLLYWSLLVSLLYLDWLTTWSQSILVLVLPLSLWFYLWSTRIYGIFLRRVLLAFEFWLLQFYTLTYIMAMIVSDSRHQPSTLPSRVAHYMGLVACNLFVAMSDAFHTERSGWERVQKVGTLTALLASVVMGLVNQTGWRQNDVQICYKYCVSSSDMAISALLNLTVFYGSYFLNLWLNPHRFLLLKVPLEYEITKH